MALSMTVCLGVARYLVEKKTILSIDCMKLVASPKMKRIKNNNDDAGNIEVAHL